MLRNRTHTHTADEPPAQPYARVTLEVEIFLETEPGSDTPSGRELPYEYLAVRSVRDISTQIMGEPGAVELLSQDGIDDLDPDSLLMSAVADALVASNSKPCSTHRPEEETDADT